MSTRRISYGTLVGAAVDYITATGSSRVSQRSLDRIGTALLAEAISDGNAERDFAAWGYAGISSGGISLGSGVRGTILRISGVRASSACPEIIRDADNVSRIDLQSTVRFSRDVSGLARYHDRELQRYQRQRKRPLRSSAIVTHGFGDTLNVGSRYSQYKGRVYDKYRESGQEEYRRCWRYEVECKDDAAKKAAAFVGSIHNDGASIAAAVEHWYRARGVAPRYKPTVVGSVGPIGAPTTDSQRQLLWLKVSVGKVFRRLVEVYDQKSVVGVLLGTCDPATLEPIRPEGGDYETAYEAWTRENYSESD